jgi:hypothetical protein
MEGPQPENRNKNEPGVIVAPGVCAFTDALIALEQAEKAKKATAKQAKEASELQAWMLLALITGLVSSCDRGRSDK